MDNNFFKHMMNRGFLIFEANSNFVLLKISTPADSRSTINDETEFDTWEKAVEKCKKLCHWNEQNIEHSWKVQMMYHHYGLGIQMTYLDDLGPMSYESAMSIAKENAEKFIERDFKKGEIEKWEVRVRPFDKSKNDMN